MLALDQPKRESRLTVIWTDLYAKEGDEMEAYWDIFAREAPREEGEKDTAYLHRFFNWLNAEGVIA